MKKKVIMTALVLFIPALIFAGGTKESEGPETVTVWHSNAGAAGEAFTHLVNEFNATHTDVHIKAIYQGKANDVLSKVKTVSISGKGLPDIAQLDATAGIDMMYSSLIRTPEDLGLDTSDILEQAYSAYETSGRHLGVPFNSSALLYYYNRTLFEENGLAVPTTIAEMREGAEALRGTGVTYFAGIPTTYELCSLLGAQNGGSYMADNKNGHEGLPTEVTFDDNGTFMNFLTEWEKLAGTGNISSVGNGTTDLFTRGMTASIFKSSSNLSSIINAVGDAFEVGVAYVPRVDENADGGVNVGGGALVAFDTGKDEEVKEVLSYLTGKEAQTYWAKATGYLPVSIEAIESEEWKSFTEENPLFSTALREVLDSSETVTGLWIPSGFQVYYSFQETIGKVVSGAMTKEDAVSFMTDMIENAIEEYAGTIVD